MLTCLLHKCADILCTVNRNILSSLHLYILQALVTEDGFEESVGVIHLAHFLMFNLLMDAVEKHGRATKTKPRMIIVGSITHNPTELAGKIPPQVIRAMKIISGVTG